MHITCGILLLTLLLPIISATIHTRCFNYFLKKDGCVHSTPGDKRCGAKPHETSAKAFSLKSSAKQKRDEHRTLLHRRYDTTQPVKHDPFGEHVCPHPYSDNQPGACLWLGRDANKIEEAGWLNHGKQSNCGKRLYIKRKSNINHTVYAPVVAACQFKPDKDDSACFQIAFTEHTFNELKPNATEKRDGHMDDILWDFDNLFNLDTDQGPV